MTPDEDVRVDAALALYEVSRGTVNESRIKEALKKAADTDPSDYVRDSALNYLRKFPDGQ